MVVKKKVCLVATVPVALKVFMREHIVRLSQTYAITLVCSGDVRELQALFAGLDVRCVSLDIERKISLLDDCVSLFKLCRFFRAERFAGVHALMPKSGLLAMIAAKMVGVPVRVHIFTGQVWSTAIGLKRKVLKAMDILLAACATHLMADSPSQRDFLVDEGIVRREKITVLGPGSISGVDGTRFHTDAAARAAIRTQLNIPADAVVYLFMARVTRAKGAIDMVQAFAQMAEVAPLAHLLVVGPDEESLDSELSKLLVAFKGRYHRVGFTDRPEDFMASADVFCLPSYREGFSLATIQAAGAGLPAIASRIYGLTDAVDEGRTGLMHEPGDIDTIAHCMARLYADTALREQLAVAAQNRANSSFSQEYIVGQMVLFYQTLWP